VRRLCLLFLALASLPALPGCTEPTVAESPEVEGDEAGECDDGVDNDQDGTTDCDDDGCEAATACVEIDPNDVDDDGDGATENDGDCDDADPNNFPGNPEVCDGGDNDCDPSTWAPLGEEDGDTDGVLACDDCDDDDPNNFPGNAEVCDGRDNDCDETTQAEGGEADGDLDGAPACADCDDGDPASTIPAEDGDCDGTPTADDCDDDDPDSTVVADDGDCDGFEGCVDDGMLTFGGSTCMCCCCGSNANNAYLRASVDPSLSGAAQATVEFWAHLDDYSQYGTLVRSESTGSEGFSIGISGDCGYGGNRFKTSMSWGGAEAFSTGQATLGVWQHYAAVFDNGSVSYFVDGVLQWTGSAAFGTVPTMPNDQLFFGGWLDGGNGNNMHQVNGSYRSIRISSTARYVAGFTPPEDLVVDADTLHLYALDEGAGATVQDSASLVHTGTLINNPTWGVYEACPLGTDCDDEDPTVHPQAGDIYGDGTDSDCDRLDCEAAGDGATYFSLCSPDLWDAGAAVCAEGGHTFGSVRGEPENTFLADLLRSSPMYQSWPTAGGGVIWLNYTNTSGAWTWGDGNGDGYTNWAPGMPDEAGACAYLDIDGSGGTWPLGSWDDTPCATGDTRALLCTDR
jgi:hypothetical protein